VSEFEAPTQASTPTCYRHPKREAPLRCTRCERPICLDDAIDAPVGFLCPECAAQPKRVRQAQRSFGGAAPTVTKVLLVAIIVAYLAQQAAPAVAQYGVTWGPGVAAGQWWRLVTGGFLHGSLIHIGFNAYLLYQLGLLLEPMLGSNRFGAIYTAGLLGGSAGIMAIGWGQPSLGASGAVFGLMGAALVLQRRRGVNPLRGPIGTLVVLNLVITFVVPGISIGGHVGGLIGGAVAGWVILAAGPEQRTRGTVAAWAVAAGLGVLALILGISGPLF